MDPLIISYVFYSKADVYDWIENATFPTVCKLRNGASLSKVRLVKTKKEAMYLAKKAFGKGFSPIISIRRFQQRWYIAILKKDLLSVIQLFGGIIRLFIPYEPGKFSHKEKGFIYFSGFCT
jgi:hypothetical protein